MLIRVATARDSMAVARAHVRSWQVGYRGLISPEYLDALRPEDRAARYGFDQMNPAGPYTQVAADGDAICGHVTTGWSRDADRHGDGEVWSIYVDPARWGTGVGRLLMDADCAQLSQQGLAAASLWVWSGNFRAGRFYESAGGQWWGAERTDMIGQDTVHEVRYERRLLAAR